MYGSISSQVADWVISGFCEVGFAQLPLEFPTLDVELLPVAAQVAVVPEGHPLAEKDVLGPADFAGEPFVSLEQTTLLRYRIDAIFSAERISREVRIETPLSMIACSLVSAGAGLSIVDPFTAAEYRGRGIVVKPFRPTIPSEVAVIWATGRFRSALALDFVEMVRAEFAEPVAA
jgi:DNA-binding transcriptional LysR family regulator